jgi:hypothetical protein
MPVRRFVYHVSCLWVLVAALSSGTQPRPTPGSEDISHLFDASDLVCAGRVSSTAAVGTPSRSSASSSLVTQAKVATFIVERYYKGLRQSNSIQVRFYQPIGNAQSFTSGPFIALAEGEHVLIFLKQTSDVFDLADPWFSKLAMSPFLSKSDRSGLGLLEADLKAGLDDPDIDSVRHNLEILGGMKTLAQTSKIQRLADSPDLLTRGAALLALQRTGDYSRLKQCLEVMSLSNVPPAFGDMKTLMASTFEDIHDQKLLPTLLRYAESPNSTVRGSVVKALRQLHDPRSVATLVARLDDPEFVIRYDATFTLATIEGRVNADWAPAYGEYKEHESKYLAQWKQWWRDEGSFKYRNASPGRL